MRWHCTRSPDKDLNRHTLYIRWYISYRYICTLFKLPTSLSSSITRVRRADTCIINAGWIWQQPYLSLETVYFNIFGIHFLRHSTTSMLRCHWGLSLWSVCRFLRHTPIITTWTNYKPFNRRTCSASRQRLTMNDINREHYHSDTKVKSRNTTDATQHPLRHPEYVISHWSEICLVI